MRFNLLEHKGVHIWSKTKLIKEKGFCEFCEVHLFTLCLYDKPEAKERKYKNINLWFYGCCVD